MLKRVSSLVSVSAGIYLANLVVSFFKSDDAGLNRSLSSASRMNLAYIGTLPLKLILALKLLFICCITILARCVAELRGLGDFSTAQYNNLVSAFLSDVKVFEVSICLKRL